MKKYSIHFYLTSFAIALLLGFQNCSPTPLAEVGDSKTAGTPAPVQVSCLGVSCAPSLSQLRVFESNMLNILTTEDVVDISLACNDGGFTKPSNAALPKAQVIAQLKNAAGAPVPFGNGSTQLAADCLVGRFYLQFSIAPAQLVPGRLTLVFNMTAHQTNGAVQNAPQQNETAVPIIVSAP